MFNDSDDESTFSGASIREGVEADTIIPGDGETFPRTGDILTVHYVGKLTTGYIFDSSVEKKKPFSFTVGRGQVIKVRVARRPSLLRPVAC